MTPEEAYSKLGQLQQQLPPEEFEVVKEQIMKPYRTRNRAVGLGLIGFCSALCKCLQVLLTVFQFHASVTELTAPFTSY
jgi:hypothetical protein